MEGLNKLNSLPPADAEIEMRKCCGSSRWAKAMVEARPLANANELIETAKRIWWSLDAADWLEAFHSHPKIGEKKAASSTSLEAQRWSSDEQSGTRNAATETMATLANLNRQYEEKFGFIFIICATGKTSEDMLASLRERLGNDHQTELKIAAAEQEKITSLRLQKLLESLA